MSVLAPLDAAMMTAELLSDPLHAAALLVLSPPPHAGAGYVDRLCADALRLPLDVDPRFRRYPHAGLDTLGMWMWRNTDGVDVSHHLLRRTLPAGADDNALWELISELHSAPLDRSRPMWAAYVIEGLAGGRFAFYIKVHHTVIDGVAGLQLLTAALSTDPGSRLMRPPYAVAPVAEHTSGPRRRLPGPIDGLREVMTGVRAALGFAGKLAVAEMSDVAAGLMTGTAVAPLSAPYTRFNGRVGRERVCVGASWPRARIRAVQEAAGVTGNDVLTTVTGGVLRDWLAANSELPGRSLIALCPVTVRRRDQAEEQDRRANLFGLQLCPLGTDLADPAERLAQVHRVMSRAKYQVATLGADVTMLLRALSIAPTVLLPGVPFATRLRRGYNVSLSSVPGPRTDMYWNGAHVDEIYPVSVAIDGQALNVTVCTYADRVTIGYVSGRSVIPDLSSLVPLTERALSELENAVAAPR
jgi:diacylglycerol O-acyltransferase / wax synthase